MHAMFPSRKFFIDTALILFWAILAWITYLYFSGFRPESIAASMTLGLDEKLGIIALLFLVRKYLSIPYFVVMILTGILLHDFTLVVLTNIVGVLVSTIIMYIRGYMSAKDTTESPNPKNTRNTFILLLLASFFQKSGIDSMGQEWGALKYNFFILPIAIIIGKMWIILLSSYIGVSIYAYPEYAFAGIAYLSALTLCIFAWVMGQMLWKSFFWGKVNE